MYLKRKKNVLGKKKEKFKFKIILYKIIYIFLFYNFWECNDILLFIIVYNIMRFRIILNYSFFWIFNLRLGVKYFLGEKYLFLRESI